MSDVLNLTNAEAKQFFLKNESYCNIDLPEYFTFEKLLKELSEAVGTNEISSYYNSEKNKKPWDFDEVNHTIIGNKDGQYAWRSFELIHPVLYVDLVHQITSEKNWENIKKHLENKDCINIKCLSLPVLSDNKKKKDKSEQILSWWHNVEQKSLELALEYNYIIHADISNCYDSIYTHSIPWALYGMDTAKGKRNEKNMLGNIIDKSIRNMRYGQTNGIPTGSVLMDLIAEVVLAGIDKLVYDKLNDIGNDYKILRYRDDYRIFVKDSFVGGKILKILSEELYKYNFRLNSSKTKQTEDIILSSVKDDKIAFLELNKNYTTIQKELLVIYKFSKSFPNSGSLVRALNNIYDKIKTNDVKKENSNVLIAIIVQLMFENPRIIPLGVGLLSLLLNNKKNKEIQQIIEKIISKFEIIPNTGFLDVWLQRLSYRYDITINYKEPLCMQVKNSRIESIWNNDWLAENKIKKLIMDSDIINREELNKMENIISKNEFDVFEYLG